MSNLEKKIRRKKEKEAKKELKKKVGLFNKLPDHCLACQKDFDKKNKDMVMTWSVVVRRDKEIVRLYCPECWEKAKKIIKEVENGTTNTESNV
jgi:hypothetical protein